MSPQTPDDQPTRERKLLHAAYILLKRAEDSDFVMELGPELVRYDSADCDGSCLRGDIGTLLEIEES